MMQLNGRWLTATKNADGTVFLEFAQGNWPLSLNRVVMTLTAADVTALSAVLSGGQGTTSSARHAVETGQGQGNADH